MKRREHEPANIVEEIGRANKMIVLDTRTNFASLSPNQRRELNADSKTKLGELLNGTGGGGGGSWDTSLSIPDKLRNAKPIFQFVGAWVEHKYDDEESNDLLSTIAGVSDIIDSLYNLFSDTSKTPSEYADAVTGLASDIVDEIDSITSISGMDSSVLSMVSATLGYGAAILATTDGIGDGEPAELGKSFVKLMQQTGKTVAKGLGRSVGDPLGPGHLVAAIGIGVFGGIDTYHTNLNKYLADGLPEDIAKTEATIDSIMEGVHGTATTWSFGLDDVAFKVLQSLGQGIVYLASKGSITYAESDKSYTDYIGDASRLLCSSLDVIGTDGDDFFQIINNNKMMYFKGGNDRISVYASHVSVYGGTGKDTVYGNKGTDANYVDLGDGNDWFAGHLTHGTLLGGNGDDKLFVYAAEGRRITNGGNEIYGGSGNDVIFLKQIDKNTVIGGLGDDRIVFDASSKQKIIYNNGDGNDVVFGYNSDDEIELPDWSANVNLRWEADGKDIIIKAADGRITLKEANGRTLKVRDKNKKLFEIETGKDTNTSASSNPNTVPYQTNMGDVKTLLYPIPTKITGDDYDNILWAGAGDTTLEGGKGNDILYGGAGVDYFVYRDGHGQDTVYNFEGNKDFVDLYNYASMPAMIENGLDVVLKVKDGESITLKDVAGKNIKIRYWYKNISSHAIQSKEVTNFSDILEAETGDVVYGYGGNDSIKIDGTDAFVDGGHGNDSIETWYGSSVSGGEGDDTIFLYEGSTIINGDNGNDYIYNKAKWLSNSLINGGEGNDTIQSIGGSTLYGGSGNDSIIVTESGYDGNYSYNGGVIDGGDGDDYISIQPELATIGGGKGNDTIKTGNLSRVNSGSGHDIIYAGRESIIYSGNGNDTINIGSHSTVYSGNGNNLIFGDWYASIYGGDNNDSVAVGPHSFINSGRGDDTIRIKSHYFTNSFYGSGNVTVKSADGNNFIDAKDCHDSSIIGGNGKDTVEIYGHVCDAIVEAGSGNDYIKYDSDDRSGDTGIWFSALQPIGDTYVRPVIVWENMSNTLHGGTGDDTFSISGDGVLIDVGGGKNYIKVEDKLKNATFSNITDKDIISFGRYTASSFAVGVYKGDYILKCVFEDKKQNESFQSILKFKNTNSPSKIKNVSIINGGKKTTLGALLAPGKSITGTAKTEVLKGDLGNDTIHGLAGNDSIYGYDGDDRLFGDAGADYLEVSGGSNTLDGGIGNDTLKGGSGNDSLHGGLGNDTLNGGAGNDTFSYADGDGNDAIQDYGTGSDVIRITKGSIKSRKASGNDVVLTVGSGTMTLKNAAEMKLTVVDANGKKVTYESLVKPLPSNASYASSQKTQVNLAAGFSGTFDASKYATTIKTVDATKNAKALTIKGNANANIIKGGSGSSKLYGQDGNDTLVGGKGKDLLEGGKGTDSLVGGAGNDCLKGGIGNDILKGGTGNDTFFYAEGDGKDTIQDYGTGSDVIRITKGTIKSKKASGKDVVLAVGSGSMSLKNAVGKNITVVDAKGKKSTIKVDTPLPKNATYTSTKQTQVNLAAAFSGTFDASKYATTIKTVDATKNAKNLIIKGNANANIIKGGSGNSKLYGQDGNDTLVGGKGKDLLEGGKGTDSLVGGAGNDSLKGGVGNDILKGGTGNDTFFYADGDGNDVIQDYGTGSDVIRLTKGTIKSKKASGKDVVLAVGNGTMKLQNAATKKITVIDANGKKSTIGPLVANLPKNASYANSSQTQVNLAAAFSGTFDASKYATTIKTVDATKNAKGLTIKGNANANIIKGGSGNSKLYGQDGNDTLVGGKGKDLLEGGKGTDSLVGGAGNDCLKGGIGNDILKGGAGNDTFFYAEGDGNDVIQDYGTGSDVIRVTKGSIKKASASGKDVLLSVSNGSMKLSAGVDKTIQLADAQGSYTMTKTGISLGANFTGTMDARNFLSTIVTVNGAAATKAVTLYGNGAANRIYAGKGGGTLRGFGGNDTLYGGAGSDVFFYDPAQGNDVIYSYDSAKDKIQLASGTANQWEVSGKDVVLSIGNGKLTVKDGANKIVHFLDAKGRETTSTFTPAPVFSGTVSVNLASAGSEGVYEVDATAGDEAVAAFRACSTSGKFDLDGKTAVGKVANSVYTVISTAEAQTIYGGSSWSVQGSTSADKLHVFGENTSCNLGAGNDKIWLYEEKEWVNGGDGNDSIYVLTSSVTAFGGSGEDRLIGMLAYDAFIDGGAGNDYLDFESRNAMLYGGAGNDTISAVGSEEYLDGGAGDDDLEIAYGNGTLVGGIGNDTLKGGNPHGEITFLYASGDGDDTISYYRPEDLIQLKSGMISNITSIGSDVVMTIGSGSITLKDAKNTTITVQDAAGHFNIYSPASIPNSTL